MFNKILLPHDGSLLAEHVLPFAVSIARATRSQLYLLYVASDLSVLVHPWTELDVVIRLEQLAGQLRDQGILASCRTMHGDPASAILLEAQETQADLIVMAPHARTGLGGWLRGSVSEQVFRRSTVPLLLVPMVCRQQWPSDRPIKLLVPLDGSPPAEVAVGPARELATQLGADMVLARVAEHVPGANWPWDAGGATLRLVTDVDMDEARQYLEGVSMRAGPFAQSISCIVDLKDAPIAIVNLARQESIDLIVMATPGQRGRARLSAGSTVAATLRRAQVPILFLGSTGPKQATLKATHPANRVLILLR